jgi:GTPase SAR1 family protein
MEKLIFKCLPKSIFSRNSFESIEGWIKEAKENADPQTSIMIVGNKCDLKSKRTEKNLKFSNVNKIRLAMMKG